MMKDLRSLFAKALVALGGIGMVAGAFDPIEGSAVILPGSGLLALGTYLSHTERRLINYRTWVFILIAFGVGAMWGLSQFGGLGGASGHSLWWGLLILPYLIGWSMGIWGPGSPRWLLWLGLLVSLWFLTLAVIIQIHANPQHREYLMSTLLSALALLTIGGCLHRLRNRPGFRA